MKLITKEDFTHINFGILSLKIQDVEFIFQQPFKYDEKRYAQNNCVLIIYKQNGERENINVEDFEEALGIINNELRK